MSSPDFHITEISKEDKPFVSKFISDNWGSPIVITRGKVHNTEELSGFLYKKDNNIVGLVTYKIENSDCELVSLDSKLEKKGLGTSLIKKVIEIAKEKGCKKLWLITTNDNTKAIRFYQKRGFEWTGYFKNSIIKSRELKPEIPEFGFDNIPIKHEIEFELKI